jgi:aspartyl/asparaginyl-tRNA synthetase
MTIHIPPQKFSKTIDLLRSFFLAKGFLEVHTQNRLSILAACEDPETVATYNYNGEIWPLPQTGQMWLEYELLTRRSDKGLFCVSTSYRQEPNPIEGRHETIFPMFEFEFPGDFDDLLEMEVELLQHLGFGSPKIKEYDSWCEYFGVDELTNEHETKMGEEFGASFITNFPNKTSPFWNMSQNKEGTHAKKNDVILGGMETIGSAERSTSPYEMKNMFEEISNGGYAQLLYDKFGKKRVVDELDEFLKHDFFPRVGGGIGITRMISALDKLENLK